ncbi:MAG: type II toxin-antitoxin system HicB family antitoxin [Thaumarchaeota archaeon]|nr:type II toxin-antitoxin system HicB family antitoxin [Nitrososphaerota archaeon]
MSRDEDGVYVAECPSLPGTVSQGKTKKEALENVTDAIEGYIASLKKHNEPVPPPTLKSMTQRNRA